MNGERKFTGGPHEIVHPDTEGGDYFIGADGRNGGVFVARLMGPHREGNAYLYAAAPELYDALEALTSLAETKVYPQPDKPDSDWAKVKAAQAALAKARGESQ